MRSEKLPSPENPYQSPADSLSVVATPRERPTAIAAVVLLVLSISTAHLPLFLRRYGLPAPLEPSWLFLLAGALPWLLQLAAVALMFRSLGAPWSGLEGRPLRFAVTMTLIVGLYWWTALVIDFWGMDPLEGAFHMMMTHTALELGGGTLGQSFLRDIIGPLVRPLCLSGPPGLHGWGFLLSLLSTTLLFAYWLRITRWIGIVAAGKLPTPREILRSTLAILIFFTPVYLRLGIRVMAALW